MAKTYAESNEHASAHGKSFIINTVQKLRLRRRRCIAITLNDRTDGGCMNSLQCKASSRLASPLHRGSYAVSIYRQTEHV